MADHADAIRGYVAKLLNSRQIAINRGSDDGVTKDMLFDVVYPEAQNIVDPESGEPLGNLDLKKKRVRVTATHPRLSVATTLSKKVNKGGAGGSGLLGYSSILGGVRLADLYGEPEWVIIHDTLDKDDGAYRPIEEEESVVKVGDPVVQVPERQPEPLQREEEQGEVRPVVTS